MKKVISCLAIVAMSFIATSAEAVQIVNVDGVNNYLTNPISINLNAGTYLVEPIGVAGGGAYDAWSAWDGVSAGNTFNCADPNGCLQSDGFRGWLNSYVVLSPNITPVSVLPGTSFAVAGQGYIIQDSLVYPTAANALSAAQSSVFTLSTDGMVGFANGESMASALNNLGGMSLRITEVPEPATMLLFGLGLPGAALLRRKKLEV